jgi:hypothetical protein
MNVIDYITITCNIKKMADYRLHPITWLNTINYNLLRLQITDVMYFIFVEHFMTPIPINEERSGC